MTNRFHEIILEKYKGSLLLKSLRIDLVNGIKKYPNIIYDYKMTIEDNPEIEVYRNCGYQFSISDSRCFLIHDKEWDKVKKCLMRDEKLNKLIDE